MAITSFEVHGLEELHRKLQELPARIEKNVMAGALRAGQKVFQKRAQANIHNRTGALSKSIKIRTSTRFGRVKAILKAGDNTAWYAHIVEFGSGSYYSGTGSRSKRQPYIIKPVRREGALYFGGIVRDKVIHPGIKPQAFMRRALDAGIQEPIEASAEYIRNRLPREIARL